MPRRYQVAQILGDPTRPGVPMLPFVVLEVFPCADGYRTRIVDDRFATEEEAKQFIHGLYDGQALMEGPADGS